MAAVAFNVSETKEYTLKSDREDSAPTVWLIGRLPQRLWTWIQDEFTQFSMNDQGSEAKGTVRVAMHSRNDNLVTFGLKGWTNFKDGGGNQANFSTVSCATPKGNFQGLSERSLEMLRPFIDELAGEVAAFNDVTAPEKKV